MLITFYERLACSNKQICYHNHPKCELNKTAQASRKKPRLLRWAKKLQKKSEIPWGNKNVQISKTKLTHM